MRLQEIIEQLEKIEFRPDITLTISEEHYGTQLKLTEQAITEAIGLLRGKQHVAVPAIGSVLHPALCDRDKTLGFQMDKVMEEFFEVMDAYLKRDFSDASKEALAEELVDLQTAAETMLSRMGYPAAARDTIREWVFEKNRKRGYFNPPKRKSDQE